MVGKIIVGKGSNDGEWSSREGIETNLADLLDVYGQEGPYLRWQQAHSGPSQHHPPAIAGTARGAYGWNGALGTAWVTAPRSEP